MTSATSDPLDTDLLDVDIATLKRLKIMAVDNYNKAFKESSHYSASWWDGYCRALEHIYEAHKQ
jgi:hypothetical protein